LLLKQIEEYRQKIIDEKQNNDKTVKELNKKHSKEISLLKLAFAEQVEELQICLGSASNYEQVIQNNFFNRESQFANNLLVVLR
jgi:hypothetical protein